MRNKIRPVNVNGKRYRTGDSIHINRGEAIFLGMWDRMCYFTFIDEGEVRFLHESFFKHRVTSGD